MPVNLKGRSFLTLKDFTPDEIRYMLNLAFSRAFTASLPNSISVRVNSSFIESPFKEALMKSARAGSERFCSQARFGK